LRCLETGLAEALDFLGMHRQIGRRQRYRVGQAGRRTRRRRPAPTLPSPTRRASHWKLAR
jgi:hypothetical protein